MLSKRGILKASIIQMAFNAMAIGLAFVREMLLANYFGASEATDAFLVAYALPYVLHTVMITVLPLVMVPALERTDPASPQGKRLLSGSLSWQLIVLGVLCVAMWLLAPALIAIQAPGLSATATGQSVWLFRAMVPIVLILPITWTLCSLLFAQKTFILPATGRVLFALVGVIVLVVFAQSTGINAAATGVLAATILQFLLMLPTLIRSRASLLDLGAARDPATRRLLVSVLVMIPVQTNLNIYLVVDRFLASHLPSGTISILNYGDKVVKAFGGITTAALGLVIFSYLSEAAASGDDKRLDSMASFALRLMMIILLPLQFAGMALGEPLIQLLFQRGAFGASEAAITTVAMNLQLAGLFATGFTVVLYRVLFALQKYKTALIASSSMVILNIVLKAVLVGPLGYKAMPLATSVAALAEGVLICWLLRRSLPSIRSRALWLETGKVFLAAAVMGAVAYGGRMVLPGLSPVGSSALLQIVVCGAAGAVVYWGTLRALHVGGVETLGHAFRSALVRRRTGSEESLQ